MTNILNRNLVFAFIILFMVVSCGASGNARVLVVPTADTLRPGQTNLGYYLHRQTHYLEANFGIVDGLSMGVTGIVRDVQFRGNARLRILEESVQMPGIAVGMEFGSKVSLYGTVSKQLGAAGVRGHLAFGSGRYSKGMAGVSAVINPVQVKTAGGYQMPSMSIALEYDGTGLNAGLMAQFSPQFSAHLAVSDFRELGLGLNYRIGF